MKRLGMLFLAVMLSVPAFLSAQNMGHQHQHQQGQQMMQQMEHMQQMTQRMSQMQQELQGLQHQMTEHMNQMGQMTEAQHRQHMQMQGMTEAMGEMANQMHSAMTGMIEMSQGAGMNQNPAMHEDMQQLNGHMHNMTENMEASLEVMRRLHTRMGGGTR